ncbi:uncharacterized protein [Zea mays]|uniref:uncharacterized protein n=1 Tax=Zea mays TaxID=4577 RepID=UPI0009A9FFA3|nr:uncharacterized protein LOC103647253 [Zea mays]|eukprot:XP_020404935.1 uncharacterized protein LOC103647253 [Zea mays]
MTDDQWKALVEMWSDAKHKEKCTKNQLNRENVRLHQRTGSRCYIAQAHVVDDMEGIMSEPVQDGQEPKSAKETVSQVVKSTTFLRVAGVCSASKSTSRGAISSQVHDLQVELENEKQEKGELRQELDNLKMESETSRVKHSEEIEGLKKTSQEMHGLLRQLLSFNQGQHNPGS